MTQPLDPTPVIPPAAPVLLKPRPRSATFKSLLLSLIIFASGTAVGWSLNRLYHPRPPIDNMAPEPPPRRLVEQMRHQLLLSDDQAQKLQTIYDTRYAALKAIRDKMLPEFKTQYDGLRSDVEKVLNPEQFKAWNDRFERARKAMQPPPPPPPPNRRGDNNDDRPLRRGPNGIHDNGPPDDGPPGPTGPHHRPPNRGPGPDDNRPPPPDGP